MGLNAFFASFLKIKIKLIELQHSEPMVGKEIEQQTWNLNFL